MNKNTTLDFSTDPPHRQGLMALVSFGHQQGLTTLVSFCYQQGIMTLVSFCHKKRVFLVHNSHVVPLATPQQ